MREELRQLLFLEEETMRMEMHRLLMGLGLAAMLSLPVQAQETTPKADADQTPATQQQPTPQRDPLVPQTQQQKQRQTETRQTEMQKQTHREGAHVLRASKINGMYVRNSRGEDLGSVEDLMIDLQSGEVRYAALSFGGFLGIGDKLFAIPWDLVHVKQQENDRWLVFDISKERLEAAPGFDKDSWPNMADPQWRNEVDRFYQAERDTRQRNTRQRDNVQRDSGQLR